MLAYTETVICALIYRFRTEAKQQTFSSILETLVKAVKAEMKYEQ